MQCVVLRAGANLDRPPPRGNAAENRLDSAWQGGFVPALTDMARGATPLVHRPAWCDGASAGP